MSRRAHRDRSDRPGTRAGANNIPELEACLTEYGGSKISDPTQVKIGDEVVSAMRGTSQRFYSIPLRLVASRQEVLERIGAALASDGHGAWVVKVHDTNRHNK